MKCSTKIELQVFLERDKEKDQAGVLGATIEAKAMAGEVYNLIQKVNLR